MSELGDRLRQARESQGLSLAQASADTRILQSSLLALEEGAYHRLPSDVVIRGFIRNYAQYLGLPPDEMIELYRRERGGTDPIRVVPVSSQPLQRTYVLPSFFGVFLVTIALIGLAYVTLNAVGRIGDRARESAALPAPTIAAPSPSPLPTNTVAPTSRPTARPVALPLPTFDAPAAGGIAPTVTPTPTATPSAPIVLEIVIPNIRGNENSWVRVQTDGSTAFEGILRSGERLVFEAQRRVFIRAGNPPDVQVTVNGLHQGPLGQAFGQPVNWYWPPN